jgi:hypothetical protein
MEYDPNTHEGPESQPRGVAKGLVCRPNSFALRKADVRNYSY